MRSVALVALLASAASLIATLPAAAQTDNQGGRLSTPTTVEGGFQPTTANNPPQPTPPRGETTAQPILVDPWNAASSAPGIAVGNNTRVYPGVTAGTFYDDNVFATNTNRRSDWAYFVRPELGVRWAGERASVTAEGYVEDRQYDKFKSENQVNGGAAVNTLWMPDNDSQVIGRFRYTHAHEDRGSGESQLFNGGATPLPTRPIAYDTYQAGGVYNRRFGRFYSSTGIANLWVNYQDPLLTDGTLQSQAYRNGEIGAVTQRFGYVVAPLTSVFVEGTGNRRDFNDNNLNNFDSRGYRVVGGVLLEEGPGARAKGEAYVGYMQQNYQGFGFDTVSTWTAGGSMAFALWPNWTATVLGSREAKESALINVNTGTPGVSVISNLVGGRIDWRIHPKVVIGGGVSYMQDEFLSGNRNDRTVSPLASLRYFINPYATFGIDYRRIDYGSSGVGVFDYYRNVVLFSLSARL